MYERIWQIHHDTNIFHQVVVLLLKYLFMKALPTPLFIPNNGVQELLRSYDKFRIVRIIVIFLLFGVRTFTQNLNPCDEADYPFTGTPATTLCEQYPNFNCNIEIGEGTQVTHSSQIGSSYTGNVCIKGDFYINNIFTFLNCVIKIDPGVSIYVVSPHSLISRPFGIKGSKLFACTEMWNGIILSNNTTIFTQNSIIEDALTAIQAKNTVHNTLSIVSTTFNRDLVGIHLEQITGTSNAPMFYQFNRNTFSCSAPLNGTTDKITFAGIKTINVPMTINPIIESYYNTFQKIQYGIFSESENTVIAGRFFRFFEIKRDGIFLNEGSLFLKSSTFRNCEENGININKAQIIDVKEGISCTINQNCPERPSIKGVYIKGFALSSETHIKLYFVADTKGKNTKVTGIQLDGGKIEDGSNIVISGSTFNISARYGSGVFLNGNFPVTSHSELYNNNFITGNPDEVGDMIYALNLTGDKNNLDIIGNNFTGTGYWNWAIYANGSRGVNNQISSNYLEGSTGYYQTGGINFFIGLYVKDFQNTTYCNNTNNNGSNRGYDFYGTNTGTAFKENKTILTPGGLFIHTNSTIGGQKHEGNEWFYLLIGNTLIIAGNHATCESPDYAQYNRFVVHTPQSVRNPNGGYSYYSSYYPDNITPNSPLYEFYKTDLNGSPSSSCVQELTNPEDPELLEMQLADEVYPFPENDTVTEWNLKSYLYKKLRRDTSLLNTYSSFVNFLSENENTNIGYFYNLSKKIEEAFTAHDTIKTQSKYILDEIIEIVDSLSIVDNQIENDSDQTSILILESLKLTNINQIIDLLNNYFYRNQVYKTNQILRLEEADLLVQSINPLTTLEINEYQVKRTYLELLLNNQTQLNSTQIQILKNIGVQCQSTGGLAVIEALTLLPECELQIMDLCPNAILADVNPITIELPDEEEMVGPTEKNRIQLSLSKSTPLEFFVTIPNGNTAQVCVFDINGKEVFKQVISTNNQSINLDNLVQFGIYFAKIQLENGNFITEKLVVNSK